MRTTLTLDDDVAALLKRVLARRRGALKDVINEALREGLRRLSTRPKRTGHYRTPGVSLGGCLIGNVDDVGEILAVGEGDAFR